MNNTTTTNGGPYDWTEFSSDDESPAKKTYGQKPAAKKPNAAKGKAGAAKGYTIPRKPMRNVKNTILSAKTYGGKPAVAKDTIAGGAKFGQQAGHKFVGMKFVQARDRFLFFSLLTPHEAH